MRFVFLSAGPSSFQSGRSPYPVLTKLFQNQVIPERRDYRIQCLRFQQHANEVALRFLEHLIAGVQSGPSSQEL